MKKLCVVGSYGQFMSTLNDETNQMKLVSKFYDVNCAKSVNRFR